MSVAAWPGPGPEPFRDGLSPDKVSPQTGLIQPIWPCHQTRESVLSHILGTPCWPACTTSCSSSLGVAVEERSERNTGYSLAILVQISEEWRGGSVALRLSPAAFTNTPDNSGSNKRAVSPGTVRMKHSRAPPGIRNSVLTCSFHHPQALPFPFWSLWVHIPVLGRAQGDSRLGGWI